MINIAIVDDESVCVNQIKQYLEQYQLDSGEIVKATVFSDGDQIVHQYNHQFDVILMDVEMKFMDGMSAAEEIRRIDSEVIIIFITNMPQYAIRGYAVQALDFLLKPVSYFAFSQCLNKALTRMSNRESKTVMLNVKGGVAKLDAKDIYYVEARGHNTYYYTANGKYETALAMKVAEQMLCPLHFFSISRWYLVNLAHVDNFFNGEVKLNRFTLPVSRSRKNEFLEALTAYWGEVIK